MATPFLYYGQDSGSLLDYYSRVLITPSLVSYVILRDSDGNPYLVYDKPLVRGFSIQEENVYSINLSGDFFGNNDESVYNYSLKSGEVYSAYKEFTQITNTITGLVSGIPFDLPKITLNFSGVVESGNQDFPKFDFQINSGLVTGILFDKPIYNFVINSGQVSGVQIEKSTYSLNINGKISPIYKQTGVMHFNFTSGVIGRGVVVFSLTTGDPMNLAFSFQNGAIGGT
jgi:hypothetical protein